MKRLIRKNQKIVKGMPGAVALSILIHGALFLLAGMLVVFTVVKKDEKRFVPPKAVERPKMKLKKPKVKVKKTSRPKPTTRIATKIDRASMPDIQLPEISSYLVTVTDEREKIIAYQTPNKWLFENLENLKNLPVGTYMDKTCTHPHPTQPKAKTPTSGETAIWRQN